MYVSGILNLLLIYLIVILNHSFSIYTWSIWVYLDAGSCQSMPGFWSCNTLDPHAELIAYIQGLLELTDNVIGWWGMSFQLLCLLAFIYVSTISSTISHNIQHFLIWLTITWIQGSATPLERAFSGGGLTGMKHHNGLNANAFESLQLLKSACWNGHILAADDATQHLDALIAKLGDEVDDDMPSLASLNS